MIVRVRAFLALIACVGIAGSVPIYREIAASRRSPLSIQHVGPLVEQATRTAGMTVGTGGALEVRVFGDYECPACAQLHHAVGRQLLELARAGDIRFTYLHAPLRAHRRAPMAAGFAYCAAQWGKGWAMHDLMYERRTEWSSGAPPEDRFVAYARELGLDPESVLDCLDSEPIRNRVLADRAAADRLRIAGVPTIYVGENLLELRGPPEKLLEYIDRALNGEPP